MPVTPDPADEIPAFPAVEEALAVEGTLVEESGRWVGYLDVVLASGAVRRRVGDWPDEHRGRIALREISRNAARRIGPDAPPPTFGGAV
jgi:hypothetical protein